MEYTLEEKIKATNKACDVLADVRLQLQKVFGVTPDIREVISKNTVGDIFGDNIFN